MKGCEREEGRKKSERCREASFGVERLYLGVYTELVTVIPILETPIIDMPGKNKICE